MNVGTQRRNFERDENIAVRVLLGEKCTAVAVDEGLSKSAVGLALWRTVERVAPRIVKSMPEGLTKSGKTKWLRQNKEKFFAAIQHARAPACS